MKLTICALAAVGVSLCHSLVKENLKSEPLGQNEPSINLRYSDIITVSNFTDKTGQFSAITRTKNNSIYQPYISMDNLEWQKYGTSFAGDGSMRVLSINRNDAEEGQALFVKLQIQQ